MLRKPLYIIYTYVSEIYIVLNFEDIFEKFDIVCQIWFDDAFLEEKKLHPLFEYMYLLMAR